MTAHVIDNADKAKAAFAALDAYTDILAGISPAYGRGHARRLEDLKALNFTLPAAGGDEE